MTTTRKGIQYGMARGSDWLAVDVANHERITRMLNEQWGPDFGTTAGLAYGYFGGTAWDGAAWTEVADGTIALTDDATNYVERTLAGVVSVNTVGFTATKVPMAKVTVAGGAITAIAERRMEQVPVDVSGLAAESYVDAAIAALVGTAPALLDTLGEISDALADDEDFAATITAALAAKAPLASPALTGTPTVPTAAPGTNTTQVASTAYVDAAVAGASGAVDSVFGRTGAVVAVTGDYAVTDVTGAAPLASPTFTGTPAAPTASPGTNTTQIATTAFVAAAVSAAGAGVIGSFDAFDPDKPEASPSALDDDFTSTPLNAKYVAVNTGASFASDVATTAPKGLYLEAAASGGTSFRGYLDVLPAGDGCYEVRVTAMLRTTDFPYVALVMSNGATSGAGSQNGLCMVRQSNAWQVYIQPSSNFTAGNGGTTLGPIAHNEHTLILRLERESGNYYWRWGPHPRALCDRFQVTPGFTATHIGVMTANNTGSALRAIVHRVRYHATPTKLFGGLRTIGVTA